MSDPAAEAPPEAGLAMRAHQSSDPRTPDWANLSLPDTWADRLDFLSPRDWLRALRPLVKGPSQAEIPPDLPGRERLPRYITQEFHGIPNGNFSKRITRGYVTAFDQTMLGSLTQARRRSAEFLRECSAVLDVGCGGGQMCGQLGQVGVADVWGVDSSPYLLQHAARKYPLAKFAHGLAEQLEFRDQRFAGVSVCFVFHELPPKITRRALAEIHRVLEAGGKLVICEPSAEQVHLSLWEITRRFGWRGLYFGILARLVYEPFVIAWHRMDILGMLRDLGFEVHTDHRKMPIRHIFATKQR